MSGRLWLILGCLACYLVAALVHARRSSATFDEVTYLPAGYAYLQWHDYRLSPEHPPLLKMWSALPLLGQSVWPVSPEIDDPAVADGAAATLAAARHAWALVPLNNDMQWWFGHYLLFGLRDRALDRLGVHHPLAAPTTAAFAPEDFVNDADSMLFAGRFQTVLLGLGLAVLVGLWTRELFGPAAAVLATALVCFDPNFIAHGSLVTTDVGLVLFWFGTVYGFWRACRCLTLGRLALTGLFLGLALASKFTAVLLAPVLALLALGWVARRGPWPVGAARRTPVKTTSAKLVLAAVSLFVIGVIGYAVLWAAYGFRYSAARDPARAAAAERAALAAERRTPAADREPGRFPIELTVRRDRALRELRAGTGEDPPEPLVQQRLATVSLSAADRLLIGVANRHLLPEAYAYGVAFARLKARSRAAFLLGQHSTEGWWYYFPVCFLVKTPLPTLLIVAGALWLVARRGAAGPAAGTRLFLLVPVAVYLAASMSSNLNIGHRHLLPVYPFLFVLAGAWADRWTAWAPARRRATAAIALGAIAVGSVVVWAPPWRPAVVAPHYLAYFNELAGGPQRGYQWVVDSNLDWGQELKNLARWLARRQVTEPVSLCYFGMSDPRYYGIRCANLEGGYLLAPATLPDRMPVPGYLVISATALQGVYLTEAGRALYAERLQNARWVDTVGYSLFVYHLDGPAP